MTLRRTKPARDLTEAQFLKALERNGMLDIGGPLAGYVCVQKHKNGGGLHVYRHNAGPRLRDQLAYLLAEQKKAIEKDTTN